MQLDRDRDALRDRVVYEQAEDGGWGAHSPDVEGVFALGASRAEAENRIAEALAAHPLSCATPVGRCQIHTPTPAASA